MQRFLDIGLITAITILTELETVNRFRDLEHQCGLDVLVLSTHSSGEKEKMKHRFAKIDGNLLFVNIPNAPSLQMK